MERTLIPSFETPSFSRRLKSMLGVDFYRLFYTPLFYRGCEKKSVNS
jgi:hypothetical protein